MRLAASFVLLAIGITPVLAQPDHSGMGHGLATPAIGAATQAYEDASRTMHGDMAVAWTGNADADFAKAMIPHHQGAIDMARIVLQYGTDPQLKALAQDVVAAQEAEIAIMKTWLAEHGYTD